MNLSLVCVVGGVVTTTSSGGGHSNPATPSSAHVGYQGSRRSAHRGRGTYRGRGSHLQPLWRAPTIQYLQFGTAAHDID